MDTIHVLIADDSRDYRQNLHREAMAEAGAVEYVLKGGELSELVAAIRKAAGGRGRRRPSGGRSE